jgi:serine/threonine-protein kinase
VAPTKRSGDRTIAPELDGVCFDALAEEPGARPTARELANRIQAYLDGDRDLARRRALSAAQLESARQALEEGGSEAHAAAMRRAGRALALDPDSEDAAALVGKLMLEPPEEMPKELLASMAKDAGAANRDRSKTALFSYAGVLALNLALLPVLDVKDWTLQISLIGVLAILCGLAYRGMVTRVSRVKSMFVVNLLGVIMFSRILGPFMLTPIVTLGVLQAFSSSPRLLARPLWIWLWLAAAVLIPIGLEVSGIFPRTFRFHDGVISTVSQFYVLHGSVSELVLVLANVVVIAIGVRYMIALSTSRELAHEKLLIQSWHLEQMLPAKRPWQTKPGAAKKATRY